MRVKELTLAALLIAALVVPGHAQVRATTLPISGDTITLRLVVGETTATATIQHGALARVARKDGPVLGLVPALRGGTVEIIILEITADEAGNEGIHQLMRVPLEVGQPVEPAGLPLPLSMELLQVTPKTEQGQTASGPCTTCCVTCGEFLFCGCRVVTECGQCCCPAACPCSGESPAAGACPAGGPAPALSGR